MKNSKEKIIITILTLIIIFVLYLICDYNNLFAKIGVSISNLNIDLFGIFINLIVVVGLYIITYFLIDKKNIETRNNQEEIIKYMLKNDYETCLRYLGLLSEKLTIERIRNHINEDVLLCKDEFFVNYINIPFENYESITNYAIQGIANKKLLESYYYIKRSYKEVVTGIVHFSDIGEDVKSVLNEGKNNLIERIQKELNAINNE